MSVVWVAESAPQTAIDNFMYTPSEYLVTEKGYFTSNGYSIRNHVSSCHTSSHDSVELSLQIVHADSTYKEKSVNHNTCMGSQS